MSRATPVAISGIGIITALGRGQEQNWSRLVESMTLALNAKATAR